MSVSKPEAFILELMAVQAAYGLTLKELSELFDIPYGTLRTWLREDRAHPRLSSVEKYMDAVVNALGGISIQVPFRISEESSEAIVKFVAWIYTKECQHLEETKESLKQKLIPLCPCFKH